MAGFRDLVLGDEGLTADEPFNVDLPVFRRRSQHIHPAFPGHGLTLLEGCINRGRQSLFRGAEDVFAGS